MNKVTDDRNSICQTNKYRDSNLELYRILCMLLIVGHHMVVNSGLLSPDGPIFADPLGAHSLFLLVFGAWGKTGINCFILITGYFMCTSRITLTKAVKLISQIYFYKIIIFIIFTFIGYEEINVLSIVKLLSPVWGFNTNFTSCFVAFWLFIPFLNILISNMTRKQHCTLLLLNIFCFSIMATIPRFRVTINYVFYFSILYFLSSFVRLYPFKIFNNKRVWGYLSIILLIISTVSVVVMMILSTKFSKTPNPYLFVADSNKILPLLLGFCSFLYFKNIKLKYNKLINIIASTTFGILLIHANSDAMRKWLWGGDFIDCVGHYNDVYMPLYFIGWLLVVFTICSLIDYARIVFIENHLMKLWKIFMEPKVVVCYHKLYNNIKDTFIIANKI